MKSVFDLLYENLLEIFSSTYNVPWLTNATYIISFIICCLFVCVFLFISIYVFYMIFNLFIPSRKNRRRRY